MLTSFLPLLQPLFTLIIDGISICHREQMGFSFLQKLPFHLSHFKCCLIYELLFVVLMGFLTDATWFGTWVEIFTVYNILCRFSTCWGQTKVPLQFLPCENVIQGIKEVKAHRICLYQLQHMQHNGTWRVGSNIRTDSVNMSLCSQGKYPSM